MKRSIDNDWDFWKLDKNFRRHEICDVCDNGHRLYRGIKVKSIVLLSGGLDSVVVFKKACDETEIIFALTFDYGQRCVRQEKVAARKCCQKFGIAHKVVRLPWLEEITETALVNVKAPIPRLREEDLKEKEEGPSEATRGVWIPNRNGAFVNIAACFAESFGASLVVTGFNREEGAAFPDNSPQFVRAANRCLEFSTLNKVRVVSYTQNLSKSEIVKLGVEIGAPLQYIYSCYLGGDRMCGRCESCQRVKRAFRVAGYWNMVKEKFRS